jgi:hypothetical protein
MRTALQINKARVVRDNALSNGRFIVAVADNLAPKASLSEVSSKGGLELEAARVLKMEARKRSCQAFGEVST